MESQKKDCTRKKPSPPIAPDGGYGWVILFASFMIMVFVDGVCFSVGLFMMEFVDYFNESKGKCSWIGSVLNGTYLSLGPIAAAAANRFGCRKVAITGGIICLISFTLTIFSSNVTVIIITYGLMGGIGFGFAYLPGIVIVGYYFEKRRALATGISVCGSGIGAFIFAPLTEKLLTFYGWRGASLIMAGITFNICIMGALFRPLTNSDTCEKSTDDTEKGTANGINNDSVDSDKNGTVSEHVSDDTKKETANGINNDSVDSDKNSTVPEHVLDNTENGTANGINNDSVDSDKNSTLPELISDCSEAESKTDKKDKKLCQKSKISYVFTSLIDLSLLKRPTFLIYGASCFLCMTGFFVPFMFLPSFAVEFGIHRDQAAFLISIIGITNTVGRVGTGWVSDQKWADCLLINNVALIIGGAATMMVPLYTSYPLMAAYGCIFGMSIAVFVILRPIIMVELMGLEVLASAFGLVTLCQGLSAYIGGPIAGSLYDATGNYNLSFYVAGGTLAMAGIICLPLRKIAHWENNRGREQDHAVKSNGIVNLSYSINPELP